MADYAANKEGIRALSRVAAREWGKYKINVNIMCPAAETPGSKQWGQLNPQAYVAWMQGIPLGRLGDPDTDIAPVVLILASDDAKYVTGLTVFADGGTGMRA